MNCRSAFFSNRSGILALILVLAGCMTPAYADRKQEDRQQLLARTGERSLSAGNREYRDLPATSTRRYSPRHNENHKNHNYPDASGSLKNSRTRSYGNRYPSGQYGDLVLLAEQRQDYQGRRAPYSSESEVSRRYQEDRETVTEQRQYYQGKRAPYSSESEGNRRYTQDRETVPEQRQYYQGKRTPYSSESEGNRRYTKSRETVPKQRQNYNGRQAPYTSEKQGSGRSSDGRTRRKRDASLDDAVSRVRSQSEGRVLSAETVRKNDREEHRVRVITDDGRVRRYRMDAKTGNILPRKR